MIPKFLILSRKSWYNNHADKACICRGAEAEDAGKERQPRGELSLALLLFSGFGALWALGLCRFSSRVRQGVRFVTLKMFCKLGFTSSRELNSGDCKRGIHGLLSSLRSL